MNSGTVDLIYLDPPFNTKRVYVSPFGPEKGEFSDIFGKGRIKEEHVAAIKDDHPKLSTLLNAIRDIEGRDSVNFCYLVFMVIRLIECRRVLKKTGSIYLHCDQTMSHYLKIAMDYIFGQRNFRNEITWQRNAAHNHSRSFGKVSDNILFYGPPINQDAVRVELDSAQVALRYRYKDSRGTYREGNLRGITGEGYEYIFHGKKGPWRYPERRMHELEADNRIHQPLKEGGVPFRKVYLHENKGQIPSNIWTDIPPLQHNSKEKRPWPTQKPLALLMRIINASSKEGDMVLDPFCGCATTPVAAAKLNREWVGIDIHKQAATEVKERMDELPREHAQKNLAAGKFSVYDVKEVNIPPFRTDGGAPAPSGMEFVYIVSNPNFKNAFKVGRSKDAYDRLNSMQTYAPNRDFELEYKIATPHYKELEKHIHKVFNADHEWVVGPEDDSKAVRNAKLKDLISAMENFKIS